MKNESRNGIRLIETDEQLKACVELLRDAFGPIAIEFGLTQENCPSNGAFIDYGRLKTSMNKGVIIYGVYNDEQLLGCIGLKQKDKVTYELSKLAVLTSVRSKGIGAKLVEFACTTAGNKGGHFIKLGLIDGNNVLKEWYQLQGFKITKTKTFKHLPFKVCFMLKEV